MEQNNIIFRGVFKLTFDYIFEYIKNVISNNHDCLGMLLLILINDSNKKYLSEKGIAALDFYLETMDIIIWPRFDVLFDTQCMSI